MAAQTFSPPKDKPQLVACLQRASDLEHVLLCAYLFTAYTVKQGPQEDGFSCDPDLRDAESKGVAGWRAAVTGVAVQEMLHLALASNMLSGIGAKPDFIRENLNFPISPQTMKDYFGYSGMAWLGLWPFVQSGKSIIEDFVWFEDYEHGPFPGPPWNDCGLSREALNKKQPLKNLEEMNISSLVELYEAIALGFVNLNESLGSAELFSGNPAMQVSDQEVTGLFNFPPAMLNGQQIPLLNKVTDLHSALTAINTIIVQGEGDTEKWQEFIQSLPVCPQEKQFPAICSLSHFHTFQQVLNGQLDIRVPPECKPPGAVPKGYLQLIAEDPSFLPTRDVPSNPLVNDPCQGDPACREHVHLITDPLTAQTAAFFDDLYMVMIDLLNLGFTHESSSSDDSVQEYEKSTLVQSAIRAMVYIMGPVGNALAQMQAGPGFVYSAAPNVTWDSIQQRLSALSCQALAVGEKPAAQSVNVWLSPSYLAVPAPGRDVAQTTLAELMCDKVAPDLLFISDRLQRVRNHAPNPDFEVHVCQGLNACKQQDITGTATEAGMGLCATAHPHVCSGQNLCAGQGGCGSSPGGVAELQNHPGQNDYPGQVLNPETGYYQFNPDSDSACGAPILPSLVNTYGNNTPPDVKRGGNEEIFKQAQGYVWDFARLRFEEKMNCEGIPFGSYDIDRYRNLSE